MKAGSPRRVQRSLAQGQAGALTFRRPGRSLEDSRSAGSGSRPGCYGRSRSQSSCGCPVHTHPGLGGGEEGDDITPRVMTGTPQGHSSKPPQPMLEAWVSGQLISTAST